MIREAVKPNTFLHHYLQYMSMLETPLSYDLWSGLWLISSAVGRSMIVTRPEAPVYLNLYAVLCADAGTTRKSSAIRRCEAVYRAAGLHNDNAIITGNATPEALIQDLALRSADGRRASVNILVSELVTFLGREQYSMGMPGLLTDLYDCPSYREGKRAGANASVIRDVYINFLAASTPSWLVRAINPDVVEGGFTSRCLFIIEEKRKRMVAWPTISNGDSGLATCVQFLHDIASSAQRFTAKGIGLTDNAKAEFIRWYERRDTGSHDPFTASFEAREDHHILRLAGLLACNDRSFVIEVYHLRHAIRIITEHKRTAAAIFGVGREDRRLVIGLDKLRNVLAEAGELGLTQTEVLFKTRNTLKTRELEYALIIMNELEMVSRFEIRTGGRPKIVWRGTSKLLIRDLNKLLTEKMTHG